MRADFDRCEKCGKISKDDKLSTAEIWSLTGLVTEKDRCHCGDSVESSVANPIPVANPNLKSNSLFRRLRKLNGFYAVIMGYFWKPCPLCGQMFGGHECGSGGLITVKTHGSNTGLAGCWKHSEMETNSETKFIWSR